MVHVNCIILTQQQVHNQTSILNIRNYGPKKYAIKNYIVIILLGRHVGNLFPAQETFVTKQRHVE